MPKTLEALSKNGKSLFGTSGIRGVFRDELSPSFYHQVAQAIGTSLEPASEVCIATDTRNSREAIKKSVLSGLVSTGIDVTDFEILPTPARAFLTCAMGFKTGVMVTASHNPPEFNGLKLFNGCTLGYSPKQEAEIERIYDAKSFRIQNTGKLSYDSKSRERYFSFIQSSFPNLNKNLKVVVDPGNGATSGFVSQLFSNLGFEVLSLNDEPDGNFPGRNPEPKTDTISGTIEYLRSRDADLAVSFDGDGDRVVFCDQEGFLGLDEMIAFISRIKVLESGKNKIATTVETGKLVDLALDDLGARVIRGRVGDVNVAYLSEELDAAIGVEAVGVYIMPEIGYYPDSIYAALTLINNIKDTTEIRKFIGGLPKLFLEKRKIPCPESLKIPVMQKIRGKAHLFPKGELNTLDGLRFEFGDSWMLVRASGTEPAIRVIAESKSNERTRSLLARGVEVVEDILRGLR
jgi:phosphoglucosamine mutase